MIKKLATIFLTGLLVGIPIFITLYVIYAAGAWLNNLAVRVATRISQPMGETLAAWSGLGILVILALIFLLGLAARFWMTARLLMMFESLLVRVPLVKTVYTSVRDMLRFFSGGGGDGKAVGKVVLYNVPGTPVRMLAILTNEQPAGLTDQHPEGMVAIWLPMSYMLGGPMLYVPASSVEPIDLSVEQVMKLAATAEVGAENLLNALSPKP
jgi:uncharacterized membrane protein